MMKLKILLIALPLVFAMFVVTYKNDVKASEFKLSWTIKTSMPTPRAQVATVVGDDGNIYVMGGYNGSSVLNVTEVYNPSTNTWQTKAAMLEGVRGAAATKGPDGLIYVISGYNRSSSWTPTVEVYNYTTDSWTKKSDITYPVLFTSAVTGDDGRIYVVGGTEPGTDTDRLQIYDPKTDTWTLGTPLPSPRTQLGVIKDRNGFIYAIGGQTWPATPGALNTVEAYDLNSESWSTRTPMIEKRNEFGIALGIDNNIYVIGGGQDYMNNNPPFFGAVMVYDTLTDTWCFDANMPTPRKELGAVSVGNSIYAIGGCNGTFLGTVEKAEIMMPNTSPTAYIDSITPNPIVEGESITFTGHGTDPDGSISAYQWRSSIDGVIGNTATFTTSTLSNGTHTIYFSVKDNSGAWSNEVTATVTVNIPITEDPLYQSLSNLISQLQQQNSDLADTVNNLTQKLDMMTYALLGAIVVAIVLGIVTIALMLRKKTPPAPTQ